MNRLFSKRVGFNDSIRFNLPLSERTKKYKIRDIRINAIDSFGNVIKNGFSGITILIDQDRILENGIADTLTGNIASLDLNQDVTATTDIEIITNLENGVTPSVNMLGLIVSFVVAEQK